MRNPSCLFAVVSDLSVSNAIAAALAETCSFSLLRKARYALLAGVFLASGASAQAGTDTWNGATDANWADSNWATGNNPPLSGDSLLFGATNTQGSLTLTNTLTSSSFNVNGITFNSGALAYVLTGDTFNLTAGIANNSSNTETFSNTGGLTNSASSTFTVSSSGGTSITTGLTDSGTAGLTTTVNGAGGTLALGSFTLNSGAAAAVTDTFNGSGNVSIAGAVANGSAFANGLTYAGTGTLALAGVNTYTGTTTVNSGTLKLTNYSTNGALAMGGGTLNLSESATGTQTFSGTSFSSGMNVISIASGTPTLALGALTPANQATGATVIFNGPATNSNASTAGGTDLSGEAALTSASPGAVAATGTITTTTEGAQTNTNVINAGLLVNNQGGAYATVGLYDWATTDIAAGTAGTSPYTIIGGSQVASFYIILNGGASAGNGGNYDVTGNSLFGGSTGGNNANVQAASFRFNTNAALTLGVNSSGSTGNPVNASGILVTPNVGVHNTTITANGADGLNNGNHDGGVAALSVFQNNPSGELIFSQSTGGATNALIEGQTYTQSGWGTVSFLGVNSYVNATFLNGGVLEYAKTSSLGNFATANLPINLNGGTLVANLTAGLDNGTNSATTDHTVVLGNNGGGLGATTGNTLTVDGVVSGTGSLIIGIPATNGALGSPNNGNVTGQLPGTGTGTANSQVLANGTVTLTGANTYTGGTVIDSGTLLLSSSNEIGSTSAATNSLTINSGGMLSIGATSQQVGGAVAFAGGTVTGSGTLQGTSYTATGTNAVSAILAGTGAPFTNVSGTTTLSGASTYTGATSVTGGTLSLTSTGTLNGTSGVTTSGSGIVSEVSGGVIGGGATFTQSSSGTSTLAGPNTYTGATSVTSGTLTLSGTSTNVTATTVSGGTLNVTGSIGAGTVGINAGGTLTGTGTIGGAVTVAGGALSNTLGGTINLNNGLGTDTLTLNNGLTLGGTGSVGNLGYSQLDFEGILTSTSDKLAITGGLTVNAGGADITITNLGMSSGNNTYTLATFTGSFTGGSSFGTTGTSIDGFTLTDPNLAFGITGALEVTQASGGALELVTSGGAAPANAYWSGAQGSSWASNNGTQGNFTTTLNGATFVSSLPGSTTNVFFSNSSSSNLPNITLGANFDIASLTFLGTSSGGGTAAVTIGADGNKLTLEGSGTSAITGSTVATGVGIELQSGAGTVSIAAPVALNASQTWENDSSNNLTVSGVISDGLNGATTLTIDNTSTGATILGGASANTYSGGTTLTAGNLTLGNVGGLSTGTVTVNGGTLNLATFSPTFTNLQGSGGTISGTSTDTLTVNAGNYSGAIANGTGAVSLISTGALTLAGANTYTGTTSVTGGTLTLNGSLTGSNVATSNGGVVTEGTGGVIGGSLASFTQGSSGTSTLGGANTYGGGTTVNSGTLTVGSAGTLGATTGTLAVNNPNTGAGTDVVLNLSTSANTTTGSLSGTIATASGGTNTATINTQSGETFTVNQTSAGTFAGAVAGSGAFTLGSSSTNTLTLTGASTYSGATTISAGTLQLGTGTAGQDGSLADTSSITDNATLLFDIAGSQSYSVNVSGTGSLNKAGGGTLTLSNANYTGSSTITGGELVVSGGSIGSATSSVNVNWGGVGFDLTGGAATEQNFNVGNVASGATEATAEVTGSGSATFTNTTLGSGGNTANGVFIGTTGSVSLGTVLINRDSTSATAPNTGGGLNIQNGAVTATKMTLAGNTGHGADLNVSGGSLTIGSSSSPAGSFVVGTSNGGSFLTVSGGSLTYLGADGLVLDANPGTTSVDSLANLTGGTTTLNAITLNPYSANSGNTSSLTLSGTAVLYLGLAGNITTASPSSVSSGAGIVEGTTGTLSVNLSGGTLGASGNWASSDPMTLTNTTTIQAANAGNTTGYNILLSGALTGTGGLTKTGAGTLFLSNTGNTYSGGTAINAGTLQISGIRNIGGSAGLNSGGLTFNGGTLQYASSASGAGTTDITNGGSASVAIESGGGTIDPNGNTITYNGALGTSGSGAAGGLTLSDSNPGTDASGEGLTLEGGNTYTGTTTIAHGNLYVYETSGTALSESAGVNLSNSNAVFDISQTAPTVYSGLGETINDLTGVTGSTIYLGNASLTAGTSNSTTFAGVIADGGFGGGTGGLFVKQGSGTLTFTGANTYTGGTTVAGGTLLADNTSGSAVGSGSVQIDSGATFQLGNGDSNGIISTNTFTNNGTFAVNRTNNVTQGVDFDNSALTGSGAFAQIGSGATTFNQANTYSGGTTIKAGILYANNTSGSATGTGNVTVGFGDTANSGTLAGSGNIGNTSTPTTVTVSGGGTIYSGPKQTLTTPGVVTGPGLTFTNTTVNVSGDTAANLTFALGTDTTSAYALGSNTAVYNFAAPSTNSTYMTLANGSTLNFAGVDSISLVDETTNATLTLRQGVPYVLVAATSLSDTAYTGLITATGTGPGTTYSLDGNGYVVGVLSAAGIAADYTGGNLASLQSSYYTPISISQYGPDGVTPLGTGAYSANSVYPAPALYLYNGDLEVVPEPGTWALMLGGLASLLLIGRMRRKNS